MRRLFAPLVLPLASCGFTPALAQDSVATRLDKARTEINTTQNAGDRALYACERDQREKCIAEVRTTRNAASRALYAVDRARELVTPVPTPLSGTLSEGDSLSSFWPGNHTGIHAAEHPGEKFLGKAVGGSSIDTLTARFDADAALRPARVTVLIGANGLPTDFLTKLAAYAARWKATGANVFLSTVTPQCNPAFNARRAEVNPGIRALGYPVIDYAADPVVGPDAAGCDKALFADGVHPTDRTTHGEASGQNRMALVYSAKLEGRPAPGAPLPTFPQAPAAPFAVSWDIALGLKPSWNSGAIPGIYNQHMGAFRFTCGGDGKLAYDDPLVYPGKPDAAHLHQVWGSTEFDAFTTPDTLRAEPATNCNATHYSLNRSSYWMPALIHDSGMVVRPDLVSVYYKRKRSVSPFCDPKAREFMGTCAPLPDKIGFLFGWDQFNPTAPVKGASWYCSAGSGRHFTNLDDLFAAGCPVGASIIANTVGPDCWNGKDLDSADHRSHMAYTNYARGDGLARCPTTHPFLIPQQENKAQFTVTADMVTADGRSRIRLSSDHMLKDAKPGQTLHADYMEAWVSAAKVMWHDGCIEKGLDCSGGDLGNGKQLIDAAQPKYGWLNPSPRVLPPPR